MRAAPARPGARDAPGAAVDVAQLAERVYQLLLEDVRLEQARRGARGLPPRGG